MRISLVLLTIFATGTQAFVAPSKPAFALPALNLMPSDDLSALVTHATECSEGECSVDEVDSLLDTLKDQQKELHDRVDKIRNMIKSLEVLNSKSADRDEVRETVRAIMRIFTAADKPAGGDWVIGSGVPTGYSGDVGQGPTSAYSALNPKPYKSKP